MTIDSYTMCPGGCGKKIKFCCGKEVVADLNKVYQSIVGDQRLAAVNLIQTARKKHGDKPCFLALEVDTYLALEKFDESREVLTLLRKQNPHNPVGLALDAIERVIRGKIEEAVEQLQRAVEYSEGSFPSAVIQAFRHVGFALFFKNKITAGRAHLVIFDSATEHKDQEVGKVLAHSMLSPDVPFLLKYEYPLQNCPEGKSYKAEFDDAFETAMSGQWLRGIEKFAEIDKANPNQAAVAFNIAVLESKLGDEEEIAAAWSQFADIEDVPLHRAVEAEALAQLIDPSLDEREYEEVEISFDVTDQEKLTDIVVASDRFSKIPFQNEEWDEAAGPPPRFIYHLLDKPQIEPSDELTLESVPQSIGEILFFGKQTDQKARCVFSAVKNATMDERVNSFAEIVKEAIDTASQSEEVTGKTSAMGIDLSTSLVFPEGTTMEKRKALIAEDRWRLINEVWPTLELEEFDGKTLLEAAKEDYLKIPTLGAILLLELSGQRSIEPLDLNPLRERLGLPLNEKIDPKTIEDVNSLSLLELTNLKFEDLSDDQLLSVFEVLAMATTGKWLHQLCSEVVSREALAERTDFTRVYMILSRLEVDTETAVAYIRKARDIVIANEQSPALIMIEELDLRIRRGMVNECMPLLKEIEVRHMREPGVSRALASVLMKYGIISPDGTPKFAGGEGGESEMVGAPAAENSGGSGGLWTPDSDSGPATGGGKLWTGE